jgi:hypothetical protein
VVACAASTTKRVDGGRLLRLVRLYMARSPSRRLFFTDTGAHAHAGAHRWDAFAGRGRDTGGVRRAGATSLEVRRTGPREVAQRAEALRGMTRRSAARGGGAAGEGSTTRAARPRAQERRRGRSVRGGAVAAGQARRGPAAEIGNPDCRDPGVRDRLVSGGLEPEEQRDFLERMKKETERSTGCCGSCSTSRGPPAAAALRRIRGAGSVVGDAGGAGDVSVPLQAAQGPGITLSSGLETGRSALRWGYPSVAARASAAGILCYNAAMRGGRRQGAGCAGGRTRGAAEYGG